MALALSLKLVHYVLVLTQSFCRRCQYAGKTPWRKVTLVVCSTKCIGKQPMYLNICIFGKLLHWLSDSQPASCSSDQNAVWYQDCQKQWEVGRNPVGIVLNKLFGRMWELDADIEVDEARVSPCLIMFYMDQWMSWRDEVHTSSLNVWFYVAVIASFGLVNSLGLNDGFNCESSALQWESRRCRSMLLNNFEV